MQQARNTGTWQCESCCIYGKSLEVSPVVEERIQCGTQEQQCKPFERDGHTRICGGELVIYSKQGPAVHSLHHNPLIECYRCKVQPLLYPKMRICLADQDRIVGEVLSFYEESGNYLYKPFPVHFNHIPGRTQIHVLFLFGKICQWGIVQTAAVEVVNAVPQGKYIHLIICNGELVCPRLQCIRIVAVYYHIVGKIIKLEPLVNRGLQCNFHILLQNLLPAVYLLFQSGCLTFQPFSSRYSHIRHQQQHNCNKKEDGGPVMEQEPANPAHPSAGS